MQVVLNKCILLKPENKFYADPSCRFREKRKNRLTPTYSIRKNDVIEPKVSLPKSMISENLKLTFNLSTV